MSPPDTAMVLAAGLGTRMRPLTDHVPKPMVPLAGRTLIDRVLDRLRDAGVRRAVVNVHHHADILERHLGSRTGPPQIVISDERSRLLDTGGGVVQALPELGRKPFVIHNSDSVWIEGVGSNLGRLFSAWDETRMDCLLLLAPVSSSIGYSGRGDFSFLPDGRIARRKDPEVVPFAFAGVSIAAPRLFNGAPQGAFSLNLPWNAAMAAGRAFGLRLEGTWMHVGTPEALAHAERLLLTGASG
ncbi:MAG: nucleotidyltransferase family protein [Hyphomicrobiaceae bacterium]